MSSPSESSNRPSEVPAPAAAATASPLAPQAIQGDESKALACYANFCRVTGTPEEILLDFGLNPQPFGAPTSPIALSQRIVCNYFTAKRLLGALQMTSQRHEQAFGALETDIQRRVLPPVRR